MIELAIIKTEREVEGFAMFKTKSQHLAILKFHILEGGLFEFREAEVAIDKSASDKTDIGQIYF